MLGCFLQYWTKHDSSRYDLQASCVHPSVGPLLVVVPGDSLYTSDTKGTCFCFCGLAPPPRFPTNIPRRISTRELLRPVPVHITSYVLGCVCTLVPTPRWTPGIHLFPTL